VKKRLGKVSRETEETSQLKKCASLGGVIGVFLKSRGTGGKEIKSQLFLRGGGKLRLGNWYSG